ncbi:helix-turn-helix domain-containing protein [Halosegnis marinus]|uniref:Helix-turn-helix domain-containing protein n=1 Tax=Halosegnis marinus TaxID=3034023 RepID=A0ABD5ZMU6_9EURY|nr:helix-turn-helix domain-containing protein [Halosegnis sp. DT85]
MPRARLAVTLPPDGPLGRVSRASPEARLRVRSAVSNADGATLLAEVTAADGPAVVGALAETAAAAVDPLARDGDTAICRVALDDPSPFDAFAAAGTPPEFPCTVADGRLSVSVVAPRPALSALSDELDAAGLAFTVEAVTAATDPLAPLTPRQRRVLRVARDRGYFETPRDCSLAALADDLGMAKSTCSEALRRAQAALLDDYLDGGVPA